MGECHPCTVQVLFGTEDTLFLTPPCSVIAMYPGSGGCSTAGVEKGLAGTCSARQAVAFNLGITWPDKQSLQGEPTLSWGSSGKAHCTLKVWASMANLRRKRL